MDSKEWFERLKENEELLKSFVASWHPSARFPKAIQRKSVILTNGDAVAVDVPEAHLPITAPAAEAACESIRREIRKESPENPREKWDRAVSTSDTSTLYSLLNSAWFGVPESRGCWSIAGFSEAVELLEDPPEDEESVDVENREDSDPDLAF